MAMTYLVNLIAAMLLPNAALTETLGPVIAVRLALVVVIWLALVIVIRLALVIAIRLALVV